MIVDYKIVRATYRSRLVLGGDREEDYTAVKPFDLDQSTAFFSCSNVKKIKMVVGCRRVQAGTQPLNMNIAPSLRIERLITSIVDYNESRSQQ